MDQRTPRSWTRAARAALATALLALALAGCGGGDEGENGTATSAVESTAASLAESPTDLTQSSSVRTTTAPAEGSTPGVASPTPAIVVSAPPVIIPTPRPAEATPVVPSIPPAPATPIVATASVTTGDGTGGPMAVVSATGGTPVATATASAASETVESCDVASYPPYTGSDPVQLTTIDVNFRAGPGTDCPVIGEIIAAGVSVDVLSDPVQRAGDDFIWVAVSLDGVQGWLATEFLEPAPE